MTARARVLLAVAAICIASFYIGRWSCFSLEGVDIEGVTAESNAVKIAALECQAAALTERIIALTEAVTFTGTASFYAYPFHGRQTAGGEIFDKDALTAASRWLPLGTWWIVTRIDDGRSVRVFVNDRGPYVGNRIIDLAEGAARALGMIDAGLVKVRVTPEGR